MLQTSFYMLVDYIALGWPECEAYLERIGVAHGKHGRDIAAHLYDLWLDCLPRGAGRLRADRRSISFPVPPSAADPQSADPHAGCHIGHRP